MNKVYRTSYVFRLLKGELNPFRPNYLVLHSHSIEFRKRNWHLISEDSQTIHFQNLVGVYVDKHLFGATLILASTGNAKVNVFGWSKKVASAIAHDCMQRIHKSSQRGTMENLTDAIENLNHKKGSSHFSIADELLKYKTLLDAGAITQEEYDRLKDKLI